MIEKEPSQTARWLAQCRGMHLLLDDDPKIYEDTFGKILANYPDDDEDWGSDNIEWWHDPKAVRLRAHAVCRSRFVADYLKANNNIRQFVILGAGLDSFAYRQSTGSNDLTIFEVNHPASQNWKKRRLRELGVSIPHNVHYVPTDFERQQLNDVLAKTSSFNRDVPTLFSFLGVIYNLPKSVALNTFNQIHNSVDGYCQLAMDIALSLDALVHATDRDELHDYINAAQEAGEP